jgi:hypothetical protein
MFFVVDIVLYNCHLIGYNAESHGCSIYFALQTKAQVLRGFIALGK